VTAPTAARPGPAETCSAAAGLKRRPAHGSVTLSAGASQPQPVKARKEYLPARLESAKRARDLTALFLENCKPSPVPDTDVTILLVSELTANAITATAEAMDSGSFSGLQSVVLSLRLFPGHLLIEVIDSSTETPRPKLEENPDAFNGRGLAVVDRLSESWGWHWYLQGSRKVVWCQVKNETPETHLLPRSFPPMNVMVALYASTSEHDPLPRRGTVQRERDEAPLIPPFLLADYPILATCTGCTGIIRKETQLRNAWEHVK
jgi:anti-sigma regulatory factor (Ser/Thr protein kinase)